MLAAQAKQLNSEDVVRWMMESVPCGHTFIHPRGQGRAEGRGDHTPSLPQPHFFAGGRVHPHQGLS